MINNLKKGYDCASTLKDILERKQIIDNYHLTGDCHYCIEMIFMTGLVPRNWNGFIGKTKSW